MPQSFSCPNCSAPLDVEGDGSATLRCPYCNTSVIIPDELRVRKPGTRTISSTYTTINPQDQANLDEKLISIREKALAGDTIEAIRLLRQTFVVGLSKARQLVDAMQHGEDIDVSHLQLLSLGQTSTFDPS